MGDQRFHLLDVGAPGGTATERARQIRLWLRDRGWTESYEGLVDWRKPKDQHGAVIAADAAGPRLFRSAADVSERAEFPITVIDGWAIYDSGDAFEGFRCIACAKPDEAAVDLVDHWYETGQAPTHTCDHCGWSGRLTAWDVRAAAACSHVAISGDLLGGDVADAVTTLTRELLAELGGEWIWIYEHI